MCISSKNLITFLTALLFFSCQKNSNINQIKEIEKIESYCDDDQKKLNKIDMSYLKNSMKIAEFNLLHLEQSKLDSLDMELIYFEYREYLMVINNIKNHLQKYQDVQNTLTLNKTQLHNLKLDYSNSNMKRTDLNKYLASEAEITQNTSKQIQEIINLIQLRSEEFDSLNQVIETFINEK